MYAQFTTFSIEQIILTGKTFKKINRLNQKKNNQLIISSLLQ